MKTEETKTLSLTDEEAYILACIIGYMKPNSNVYSLLEKMDALVDKELDCDDYERIGFQIDIEKGQVGNVEIVFN